MLSMSHRTQHRVVQKVHGTGRRQLSAGGTARGGFFTVGPDAGTGRIHRPAGKTGPVSPARRLRFQPESTDPAGAHATDRDAPLPEVFAIERSRGRAGQPRFARRRPRTFLAGMAVVFDALRAAPEVEKRRNLRLAVLAVAETGSGPLKRNHAVERRSRGAGGCDALVAEGEGDAPSPGPAGKADDAPVFSRDGGVAPAFCDEVAQRPAEKTTLCRLRIRWADAAAVADRRPGLPRREYSSCRRWHGDSRFPNECAERGDDSPGIRRS